MPAAAHAGLDLGDDAPRVLGARVVGGEDDEVAAPCGGLAHERPLAAVAVAAAAEDGDQAARRERPEDVERARERVGRVGVVDDHGEARARRSARAGRAAAPRRRGRRRSPPARRRAPTPSRPRRGRSRGAARRRARHGTASARAAEVERRRACRRASSRRSSGRTAARGARPTRHAARAGTPAREPRARRVVDVHDRHRIALAARGQVARGRAAPWPRSSARGRRGSRGGRGSGW